MFFPSVVAELAHRKFNPFAHAVSNASFVRSLGQAAARQAGAEDLSKFVVNQSGDAKGIQARITKNQQDLFDQVYRPREAQLLNAMVSSADAVSAGRVAGLSAARSFDAQGRNLDDAIRATGQRVTAGQAQVIDRSRSLARALARTQAANKAVSARRDSNVQGLNRLLQVAQGLSSAAGKGSATAANMASTRAQINRQNRAAAGQTGTSLLSSAAMLALLL